MSEHRSCLSSETQNLVYYSLRAVVVALERYIPKKPIFVDVRFRNHGRSIADGSSLSKCFKCPGCGSHIFHVFDSEHFCVHCGQALDWSVLDAPSKEVTE